jgi:hypothetical protein
VGGGGAPPPPPPPPPGGEGGAAALTPPAPRIIEKTLLKLGIEVSKRTIQKYIARVRQTSGQTWATFLKNHAGVIELAFQFDLATMSYPPSV